MTLRKVRPRELKRNRQTTQAQKGKTSPTTFRYVLIGGFLVLGTFALYGRVIGYPFVIIDDWEYVTTNPYVHLGLSWSTVKWAFTATTAANWHPLTWISHALDYQIFGLNAGGHHADSLLIHALNVILLFWGLRWFTRQVGPSLLAAALFACHPLNVESVAWVAERKNVLCTLFFLGAIGAYAWYAKKPDWRRYLAVVFLFAFGLMAKPMVITFPFALLLLDYWPLERTPVERTPGSPPSAVGARQTTYAMLIAEKIPLFLLSAASAVITVKAQGYAVRRLYQITLSARIENAIVAYGCYLWKTIWPEKLAFAYPLATFGIPAWQWLLSGAVLAGITVFAITFRKYRYLLVGWCWFLGMLVPVIGLVQVGDAAMADRYAYLPLIGIFVAMAWGADDLASRSKISRRWQYAAGVFVVFVLGVTTYRQIGYWDSEYDLWTHSLEVTGNVAAHDALGAALMDPQGALSPENFQEFDSQEKRMDEARRHLEKAVEIRRDLAQKNPVNYLPDLARALNNLANFDQLEGKDEEAKLHYEEALGIYTRLAGQALNPNPEDWAIALSNLARLEARKQESEQASEHFAAALQIYRELARQNPERYVPKVADELDDLAAAERDEKRTMEARRDDNEALQIRRRLADQYRGIYLASLATTLNNLGVLDGIENKPSDAIQHFQEALSFYRELSLEDSGTYAPYLAGTLANLARSCANDNRMQESRAFYSEALAVYQKLSGVKPNEYEGQLARVEASLRELDAKTGSN